MLMDWTELIATGDLATILVVIVLILVSGGVGAAVVNGISASRRGVKGDALINTQNGINGLSKLTEGQASYITTLENRINKMEESFNEKVDTLLQKLESEIDYSNLLITTLSENTIPIPPRRYRRYQ